MNIEHLIEHAGNMESDGIHTIELGSGFYLFFRQPFLVGEGKFEFVAVEGRMFGTLDREDFFHLDLADARQVVDYLLVFITYLFLIRKVLPFTAAATRRDSSVR